MVSGWACDSCGTLHAGNPDECRNCGGYVMQPMSDEEVKERTVGTTPSDSLDTDGLRGLENGSEEGSPPGLDLNLDDRDAGRVRSAPAKWRNHSPENVRRLRALAALALFALSLAAGSLVWLMMH